MDNHVFYEIGDGDIVYSFQDLLTKYEGNSTTYQRNIMDYQIQALAGTIADESYANINNQYLDVLQKISELKVAKEKLNSYMDYLLAEEEAVSSTSADDMTADSVAPGKDYASLIAEINTQIAAIDAQLSQYMNTRSSLATSVAESKLQADVADFYSDYQSLITKEAQSRLKNDFMKNCYSLIIYKEQLDYNNSYQDYLDFVVEVDTIKFKFGLTTQITLDADSNSVLQNEITIIENQNTYDAVVSLIRSSTAITDNAKIRINLNNIKKQYNMEATINQFINSNSSYYQIQNYIRSYQNYLSSVGTASYTSYRQAELRIKNYQLQKEELEDNIRAYVKRAIKSYDIASQSREVTWNELQVKIKSYNATKTKLEYKRASRIQLQQALYEKEAAEVKYYQSCYQIIVWQDILDNNIYGVTP
jgi:chorismate mutase